MALTNDDLLNHLNLEQRIAREIDKTNTTPMREANVTAWLPAQTSLFRAQGIANILGIALPKLEN
jgi:hypothetical protein